jgi:hypothetical protein
MDTPNVLWFFGAFAIAFATIALIDKVPESNRDVWVFLVAAGFYIAYAGIGLLFVRGAWWIPGSLLVAVAVALMPAVGYGVASLIGTFPKGPFFDPFQQASWSVIVIGLVTMLDALVSFALTRFSFIFFTFTVATSLTAQFFLPAVDDFPSSGAHLTTAIVVGAALVLIGLALDAIGRRRDAFWFHAIGFLGVAAYLGYYAAGISGSSNRGWIPMCIAGAFVLLAAAPLRRATWAVYGLLGFYVPLLHWLTSNLSADSVGYAAILLAIGLSIFLLGIVLHRFGRAWTARWPARPTPQEPTSGTL